jgi:hypothetical protein
MITDVTPEIEARVQKMLLNKLRQFWIKSPDELRVPLDCPDAIPSLCEQACDWIAYECEQLGTRLATRG